MIEGNFERAYGLMSPGYRAVVPLQRFASQFGSGVRWQRAQVVSVRCETERCDVVVKIDAQAPMRGHGMMTFSTGYDEIWVREDGQWWKYEKI